MTPAQFRARRARAQARALAVQPQLPVGWWLAASAIAIATLLAFALG